MQLVTAILVTLLRSALIIAVLVAILFGGHIALSEAGPSVRERFETPDRLEELQATGNEHAISIAERRAGEVSHQARQKALRARLQRERDSWQEQLEEDLQAIEQAAIEQVERVEEAVRQNQIAVGESITRLEDEYCNSWSPVDWWACRAVRSRIESINERAAIQRNAVERSIENLGKQAREDARRHREAAEARLDEQTAEFETQLQASIEALDDLEAQRQALHQRIAEIQEEEAALREDNWLWIEFHERWAYLLAVALLIFAAPFIRRTLWYFAGMPLVSKAAPIELSPPASHKPEASPGESRDETSDEADGETKSEAPDKTAPAVQCGKSHRTLNIEIPAGRRLLARPGYIQSDRTGAKSELFFDRQSPNLSYISGLVLLTRLEAHGADVEPRKVMLGTPDDPDAYLMRVDLEDHPGVVLRASHVAAVIGDIQIDSTWRLGNLHAWATSQIRFIVFSGTGTLILEGYGDVHGRNLEDESEQKRMHLVIGFDTRLTYQTQRAATFLPYLIDPGREPLVVDIFEGTGTVFFEKNPSARKRHRSTGEAIAGFFLDAFRKLLGL